MRIPSFLIALCLLAANARAHDESPYYVQLGVGAVMSDDTDIFGPDTDFDTGVATSLAFGRHCSFSERFGVNIEVEGYYQYFTVDETDLLVIDQDAQNDAGALAVLLNGLLEWRFTDRFSVYGGVGAGWANSIQYDTWDSGNFKQVDNDGFCSQGRFGFDYNLGGNYDVLFGYRYFVTDSIEIKRVSPAATEDLEIGQHVLEIAFRWGW